MNADGGMVSIALLIVLVALCIAGFAVDQLVYKPRRLKAENKSHRVITGTAQEFDPLAQWCSPPPGGVVQSFGTVQYANYQPPFGHTSDGPVSPLAQLVWKAHTDAERLDTAILTGTASEIFDELATAQESAQALTDYLINVEGERL